ncbi:MAG: hypothetical protein IIC29_08520, partial [Chloroflexi bacterium]|nr:hypothetical protein [Chloroflexota bacterium]
MARRRFFYAGHPQYAARCETLLTLKAAGLLDSEIALQLSIKYGQEVLTETVSKYRRRLRKDGPAQVANPGSGDASPHSELTEQHERTDNVWEVRLHNTPLCTQEDLIAKFEVDMDVWRVEKFSVRVYDQGSKDAEGNPQALQLHSILCKFERKVEVIAAKVEIDAMLAAAAKHAPRYKRLHPRKASKGGYLLEMSIPDLHLGKLSDSTETGGEAYSAEAAVTAYHEAVEALLTYAEQFKIERILFPVGSDLLHVDSSANTTTRGTPQDTSARYQRLCKMARELMVDTIDRL